MESKVFFAKSWSIAFVEYQKWLNNPRMIILLCAIVFMWNFAISPLVSLSEEMNSPLNALEPFIAVLNSKFLCLIMPAVYLFLISDYPRLDKNGVFVLSRVGRVNWFWGQLNFFFLAAFTFMSIIFIGSFLPIIFDSFLANGWSVAVTRYEISFPDKSSSFAANLITKELYNQVTPFMAASMSFLTTFLYLFLLSAILLLFYTFNLKQLGSVTTISIIAIGSALGIIKANAMWCFPMAHTMINLHFTEYFKKPVLDFKYSILYFLVLIFLLISISFAAIKRTNFVVVSENE